MGLANQSILDFLLALKAMQLQEMCQASRLEVRSQNADRLETAKKKEVVTVVDGVKSIVLLPVSSPITETQMWRLRHHWINQTCSSPLCERVPPRGDQSSAHTCLGTHGG